MPRSPQWIDLYQIWFGVSSRGRNQLCGILLQSAHGFRFCEGSKFAISHWLGRSPLTQCWRYRAACDKIKHASSSEWTSRISALCSGKRALCFLAKVTNLKKYGQYISENVDSNVWRQCLFVKYSFLSRLIYWQDFDKDAHQSNHQHCWTSFWTTSETARATSWLKTKRTRNQYVSPPRSNAKPAGPIELFWQKNCFVNGFLSPTILTSTIVTLWV